MPSYYAIFVIIYIYFFSNLLYVNRIMLNASSKRIDISDPL